MRQEKTIGREEKFRLNLWLEKKFEVEWHNQLFYRGEVTYSQTLNQFSDLTAKEYADVNGFRGMEAMLTAEARAEFLADLAPEEELQLAAPAAWDWEQQGAVGSVKTQK